MKTHLKAEFTAFCVAKSLPNRFSTAIYATACFSLYCTVFRSNK